MKTKILKYFKELNSEFKSWNDSYDNKILLKEKINLQFPELQEWEKYRLYEMSVYLLDEIKELESDKQELNKIIVDYSNKTFFDNKNLYPEKYLQYFEHEDLLFWELE